MLLSPLATAGAFASFVLAEGNLLGYEKVQLDEAAASGNSLISFAGDDFVASTAACKTFPGEEDWPAQDAWASLNDELDGNLLHPTPPGAVCYPDDEAYDADACLDLVEIAPVTHFYLDDPLSNLSPWFQGSTCVPHVNATGRCDRGGYAEYVVNASSVKDVQAAVNFARNNNVRLVVKNTGHSFGGRSVGAGSLSIWTHNLKEYQFFEEYSTKDGEYVGPALQYGAGLETQDLENVMVEYNMTVNSPGGKTVGAGGGWMTGGGHGNLASLHGLGADQVLELHVVTADGQFLIATPHENEDLFFALRGSGSSTFGVVTSWVVRAFPWIDFVRVEIQFQVNNGSGGNMASTDTVDTFFDATKAYYEFMTTIIDAGGVDWNYIWPRGEDAYEFKGRVTLPGFTVEEGTALLRPIYSALAEAGVRELEFPAESLLAPQPYASKAELAAFEPVNTRYRSRLLLRENFAKDNNTGLFSATMAAIRQGIEDGRYTFHGLSYAATKEVVGWPGNESSVNPAWRRAVMHSIFLTAVPDDWTAEEISAEEATAKVYMDELRGLSPGAGSYMNEGDPAEPDWQQSFYGDLYPRLLEIKENVDPWQVFWAPTTVGSEGWGVVADDIRPRSQNGKLCKV